MRFYVASGLANREQAMDMIRFLSSRGHTPTYDWTEHGDVRGQGLDRLQMVATSETSAVISVSHISRRPMLSLSMPRILYNPNSRRRRRMMNELV